MNWTALLETLGGTAIMIAAVAWLSRTLVGQLLKKEYEQFKSDLTTQHKRELKKFERQLESEASAEDRIRQEILRWANPVLEAVLHLQSRLDNILHDHAYPALDKNFDGMLKETWSISYAYLMPSTLYSFASFFAWVRMLRERMSFELFRNHKEKDRFYAAIRGVQDALSDWPPHGYECSGPDTQVFTMQQRAIGEMLIVPNANKPECMSYHAFLSKWTTDAFQSRLSPLCLLLEGLQPADKCRWKRLQATLSKVHALRQCCEELLQLPERNVAE